MRIVKLSKEVLGVDTLAGCKAFFESVLPCEKNQFDIVGEGNHIAKDAVAKNEPILFSFGGSLACIALVDKLVINNNKAVAIILKRNSIKAFKNTIKLNDLESVLQAAGYNKKLLPNRGWNKIDDNLEKVAVEYLCKKEFEYLREKEWEKYIR